jgi:hypothetical protein
VRNQYTPPSIIDVEASGFGPDSYPIELGVALSCGKRLSMLIKPMPQWTHWDPGAQEIHGLSRKLLMQAGKAVEDIAFTFNALLDGQTLYSDAWVVDKPWITTLFYGAGQPMSFCVSPIEQIMKEAQFELWDRTKIDVIHELDAKRHRASQDAWVIQKTFMRTQQQIEQSDRAGDSLM